MKRHQVTNKAQPSHLGEGGCTGKGEEVANETWLPLTRAEVKARPAEEQRTVPTGREGCEQRRSSYRRLAKEQTVTIPDCL